MGLLIPCLFDGDSAHPSTPPPKWACYHSHHTWYVHFVSLLIFMHVHYRCFWLPLCMTSLFLQKGSHELFFCICYGEVKLMLMQPFLQNQDFTSSHYHLKHVRTKQSIWGWSVGTICPLCLLSIFFSWPPSNSFFKKFNVHLSFGGQSYEMLSPSQAATSHHGWCPTSHRVHSIRMKSQS